MRHFDRQTHQDPMQWATGCSLEKKVRFATKTTHRSADKAKTAGLFLGMALILLSIIKSYESTLAPSPLPRSNPLESIPGTSLMAEPFSSSPRPQSSPLGPCRCPPLLPTAFLSAALSLGASCKNEYVKIHPPGGPLQVEKYHPFGNLTPFWG